MYSNNVPFGRGHEPYNKKYGNKWWAEFCALQMMSLLVMLPDKDNVWVLREMGIEPIGIMFVSADPITLPGLQPGAVPPPEGWGFYEQVLYGYPFSTS